MPNHELKYNLSWIDGTFNSRASTELLLSPEREQGNLTSNDYELATRFLPGPHRYYPRGYGVLAGGTSLLYARSRNWSTLRLVVLGASAYTLGFAIGQAARIRLHLKFLSSLENVEGFSTAITNINQKTGGIMPRGPTLVVSAPKSRNSGLDVRPDVGGGRDGWDESGTEMSVQDHVNVNPAPATSTPSNPTKSRWDEIRAANSHSVNQSSWELIRQKHGKTSIQDKGTKAAPQVVERPFSDEDRRAEQERFDALLEAERKIGQSSSNV